MYFWKTNVAIFFLIQHILIPEKVSALIFWVCASRKNVSVKVSPTSVKENLDTTSSAALFAVILVQACYDGW